MLLQLPEPPIMDRRPIAPPASIPGTQIEVQDREVRYVLYLPEGYRPRARETLTVHFHGATWFAIEEHRRRGLSGPLIAFQNGQGSSVYKRPFEDRSRLARWIARVDEELARRGGGRVVRVDLSSFSAGYGAVREIVKSPDYVRIVHRVVLADSLYAGYEPLFPGARSRRPARPDIEPWRAFAQLAAKGEKELVVTHSQVPTETYANSADCAAWVAMMAGGRLQPVSRVGGDYPLLARFDRRGLHVWAYAGYDADAHTVHARRIAEIWRWLDSVAEPKPSREGGTRSPR